jgi:hypothetical protein
MAMKRKDNRDIPDPPETLKRHDERPAKNRIGLPEDIRVLYDREIPPRER